MPADHSPEHDRHHHFNRAGLGITHLWLTIIGDGDGEGGDATDKRLELEYSSQATQSSLTLSDALKLNDGSPANQIRITAHE